MFILSLLCHPSPFLFYALCKAGKILSFRKCENKKQEVIRERKKAKKSNSAGNIHIDKVRQTIAICSIWGALKIRNKAWKQTHSGSNVRWGAVEKKYFKIAYTQCKHIHTHFVYRIVSSGKETKSHILTLKS